ncbi:hypothetical protein ABW19_dt0208702 [Dactylella cylindrospora]|nr:hypothetical protein ABW19_dt0208702 [Dactylella cylindrospora]
MVTVEAVREKWQDTLPHGLLSLADQRLWTTLYGQPTRWWGPKDARQIEELMAEGMLFEEASSIVNDGPLKRKEVGYTVQDGIVEYHGPVDEHGLPIKSEVEEDEMEEVVEDMEDAYEEYPEEEEKSIPLSQRILQAEAAARAEKGSVPEELAEYVRVHPLTARGRFATLPITIIYPKPMQDITRELLKKNTKFPHMKDRATRYMPPPLLVPAHKKGVMASYHPNLQAETQKMDQLDAAVWLGVCLPEIYAVNLGVATEIRRRLGGDWALGVKKVLDVGGGGAGIIAWGDVVRAEEMAREEERQGKARKEAEGEEEDAEKEEEEVDAKTLENESSDTWDWGHGIEGVKASSIDGDYKFEATVVTGSHHLRALSSQMLHNTTFLPRTPYFQAPPGTVQWDTAKEEDLFDIENPEEGATSSREDKKQPRVNPKRSYDLIFASYSMKNISTRDNFKHHVDNLWRLLNPGGVLCFVESGNVEGFDNIANARQHLLRRWIKSPLSEKRLLKQLEQQKETEDEVDSISDVFEFSERHNRLIPRKKKPIHQLEDGMIVAPCPNHKPCPMHTNQNTIFKKSKDVCKFAQKYQRPPILRRVLGPKRSDTTSGSFSYVAVRRGIAKDESVGLELKKAKEEKKSRRMDSKQLDKVEQEYTEEQKRMFMHLQPRLILPPIKGHHHVLFDVCTNDGTLERWTVPKSYANDAYRAARKARLGDIWVHGAKTKVLRVKKSDIKQFEDDTGRKLRKREVRIRNMQYGAAKAAGWKPKEGYSKRRQYEKLLNAGKFPRIRFQPARGEEYDEDY